MDKKIKYLGDYINSLQSQGCYTFLKEEAKDALGCSDDAFRSNIKRLSKINKVHYLKKGLYIIIPLEYLHMQAPPANWYIDALMKHMKIPYYVGLLTAASYHGASHQASQIYQVMVDRSLPPLRVGRSTIRFYKNSLIETAKTISLKSHTGLFIVSSPEQTVLDLVNYIEASGGLNNISTILEELQENMSDLLLSKVLHDKVSASSLQRLGFILDLLNSMKLSNVIRNALKKRKIQPILLNPSSQKKAFEKNKEWQININDKIETDI
tara:strand:- start:1604 stop:2404 length:801 start_codon:yes stop_codon:yes gene_type:complete